MALKVSEFGENLWNKTSQDNNKTDVPMTTTLAIYCDSTYTNQRKMLSSAGIKIIPIWSHLCEEQACITPPVHHLPEPSSGVYFTLAESVSVTMSRILQLLPNSSTVMDPQKLSIKFGFDGSGSHAIYHQAKSELSNNIVMTKFCPLKLEDISGNLQWDQTSPNSPLTQQPLCFQMGKESSDSLQALGAFNEDIAMLKNQGIGFTIDNTQHTVKSRCHPDEVGKWVPVYLLGSNCGNTRERSGTLPYQLVEANEKGAFGSPLTVVSQFDFFLMDRKQHNCIWVWVEVVATCAPSPKKNVWMTHWLR